MRLAFVAVMVVLLPGVAVADVRLVGTKNVRAAKRFAATRDGSPSFAVFERGRTRGFRGTVGCPAASLSKAMILVAKLRSAHDRALTADEKQDLGPMITESSNKAARKVFATVGPDGLNRVASAAVMQRFGIQLSSSKRSSTSPSKVGGGRESSTRSPASSWAGERWRLR